MNLEFMIEEEHTDRIMFSEDIFSNYYIGFSFHQDALHNKKMLNSLYDVIPKIKDMFSHKGSLSITFEDDSCIDLSGLSTPDIIKKLVREKLKNMTFRQFLLWLG